MRRILDPIDIRDLNDGTFLLLHDFEYHVGSADSDDIIIVKKGFLTDFASVPKWAWWYCHPLSVRGPALIHDNLYYTQTRPRKECDKIFLEAMKVWGVRFGKRHMMYEAVRVGGWYGWNRRKKELQEVKV